jgi:hypothetical protein
VTEPKKFGPWDDRTPKTRWRMMWGGAWCPVLRMIDMNNTPTTLPLRAVKVVLYAEKEGEPSMVAVPCGPADVLTNPDHVTTDWELID